MVFISLGAGVQSSTMFLMACRGEITPKPDGAIFADTQGEPPAVYEYLDWLEKMGKRYGIPVYRVTRGSLKEDTEAYVKGNAPRVSSIPAFVKVEGQEVEGRLRRQCTGDYKIMVVRKQIRSLLKEVPKKKRSLPIELWIGISTDEITRMKESNVQYIVNRWPLIEQGMSRTDCLKWYKGKRYPTPARSACTFCPYRKNEEWQRMKEEDPESFADAVAFDKLIRKQPKLKGQVFLHRSLVPLENVDFSGMGAHGFEEECEGMCGI